MTDQIETSVNATEIDADAALAIATPGSVVSSNYKRRYAERAAAKKTRGMSKKAASRSCGDWLAVQIAKHTLDEKDKLIVEALEDLLDANGVAHSHWNRTTKGWQGRLRMTGRLALQRVVAEADGELVLPDGSTEKAPRSWVAKHVH